MYIRLEKSLGGSYLRISYEGHGKWYYRLDGIVPSTSVNTITMIEVILDFVNSTES